MEILEDEIIIEDEEIKIDDDSVMEDYFSDDAFKDFFNKIRRYPLLSREENNKLAFLAQQGDEKAQEKLIKCNLRLVLYVANRYRHKISHLSFLDICQEGVLGLIKSINMYDAEKGNFSTYAFIWIRQAISEARYNKEDEIKEPKHYKAQKEKYINLIDSYKKENRPLPSDDELCEMLEISKKRLTEIRTNNSKTISLNQLISDNSDTELENFIIIKKDDYDDIEKNIDNFKLFIVLKEILTPYEYYIIYCRYFIYPAITFESLAEHVNLSKSAIQKSEERALKKIEPYMQPDSIMYSKVLSVLMSNDNRLDLYNIKPAVPEKIMLYLYLKNSLNDVSRELLYYSVFGNMKIEYYLNKEGISKEEYATIKEEINKKIKEIYSDKVMFNEFKKDVFEKKGTSIFNFTLMSILPWEADEIKLNRKNNN